MSSILLPAATILAACQDGNGDGDTNSTGRPTDTEDTANPADSEDTASPDSLGSCDSESLQFDYQDYNNNGAYDQGTDIAHTVYLSGGCSLATAKEVLDTHGNGSGTILLTGGDSDVYVGGLTVGVNQEIKVALDNVATATIIGLDSSGAIFTNNSGSLAIFGDNKLRVQGFGTNTAIASTDGEVEIEGVDFDNLDVGLDISAGELIATDVRMTQIQDIGIYLYNHADATMSEIIIDNGLIGTETRNAILADSAGHLDMQKIGVFNQQTSGAVIDISADYMLLIGLVALHNRTTENVVRLSAGTEYESIDAKLSYFASSTASNNYYGEKGALSVASEGNFVATNIDVLYNYSDGAKTVVDLSDPDNPYAGVTTFTQSNVVGNTGLNKDSSPILRSYVTEADVSNGYVGLDAEGNPEIPLGDPTGFERIEYNNIYDNGEGRYEDIEGNNLAKSLWSGASPSKGVMYNPDEDPLFYPDAFRVTNHDLLNAGNPNAQYPDYAGYPYPKDYDVPPDNTGGSITSFGGPVGDILELFLPRLSTELP